MSVALAVANDNRPIEPYWFLDGRPWQFVDTTTLYRAFRAKREETTAFDLLKILLHELDIPPMFRVVLVNYWGEHMVLPAPLVEFIHAFILTLDHQGYPEYVPTGTPS